jgi:hypothetical protein
MITSNDNINDNINDNTKYIQGKSDNKNYNICLPWKMITSNDNINDNILKMIT